MPKRRGRLLRSDARGNRGLALVRRNLPLLSAFGNFCFEFGSGRVDLNRGTAILLSKSVHSSVNGLLFKGVLRQRPGPQTNSGG